MTALFGYVLWLCSTMPELSMDAFFRLIGRSTRQHDLLELFRFTVQTSANGTSPLKLGIMLGLVTILLGTRQMPADRISTLLIATLAAALGSTQLIVLSGAAGTSTGIALIPATVSTFATFWWTVHHTVSNAGQ